jgi:hypothetical protein
MYYEVKILALALVHMQNFLPHGKKMIAFVKALAI